ncbi:sugar phosphate nucleotidyltransferase [Alcanivorax sp.]|uniref:sugar phosphate nucleotidyltransferase n=1 Tax=Alcanivorax sp. TaxID=1872427 RepID=UPI00258E77DD|nr:sugar phosphate nucleotidyltransferase [Alcanivorax sp.]
MSKRAVILAGGKGARLRPYTVVLPKPLMPIGEFPILEVIVRQLSSHGFDRITMAVNHQAEIIKAFFGDGEKWGVHIDYSLEDVPLGTMGPLKLINDLPEHFLVMNGDILSDLDFSDFYHSHVESRSLFSIASHVREELVDYGVLKVKDGQLMGMEEKPRVCYEVSMGIYMLSKDVLRHIPEGANYGFDLLMRDMLSAHLPVRVIRHDGYWLDIGRPDDYVRAIDEFDAMRQRFLHV